MKFQNDIATRECIEPSALGARMLIMTNLRCSFAPGCDVVFTLAESKLKTFIPNYCHAKWLLRSVSLFRGIKYRIKGCLKKAVAFCFKNQPQFPLRTY